MKKVIGKTHGLTGHPLYRKWCNIKGRCYWNKTRSWKNYEGKGITMCAEWKGDFMTFYNWSIANGWHPGLTIDRIDSNKSYEPSNCQFLTLEENSARVKRARRGELSPSHKLTDNHVKVIKMLIDLNFSHAEIAKFLGVSTSTVTDIGSNKYWGHVSL